MNKKFIDYVLNYKNQNVIDKFCDTLKIEEGSAQIIFQDMLIWLCINHINSLNSEKVSLYIDYNLRIIDEMWHCFILHTLDYEKFCHEYFKKFIHHQPASKQEKEINIKKIKTDLFSEEYKNEIKKTYSFIYDLIGKEAFLRWFRDYPDKYYFNTKQQINNGTF